MPQAPKSPLDDSYRISQITDFSSGLVTYLGALSLPLSAAEGLTNLVQFPGRLKYRGGSQLQVSPYVENYTGAGVVDMAYSYYDASGQKTWMFWIAGLVYYSASGAVGYSNPISGESYTAGQQVGVCDINGTVYWATETVPLRFFTQGGPWGAVVQTGPNAPPASPYLFTYTGAIVALGVQYGSAAYQPCVMGWSSTDDPGYWDASNSQAVGDQDEGVLRFGVIFGMANSGVPPTRTFIVGRSGAAGIYSYTGALGSLAESVVNCPVGCLDGRSAVFIPGAENFGLVVYLGEDSQFWGTNGMNANVISLQILDLLQATVQPLYESGVLFWAGYCNELQYYLCQIGTTMFMYKWDLKSWSTFKGWPTGPMLYGEAATDGSGVPQLFVASNVEYVEIGGVNRGAYGTWLLGLAGKKDLCAQDGTGGYVPDSISYTSPWIHAGNAELLKIWHWLTLYANSTGVIYQVTARGLTRANDGTFQETNSQLLIASEQSPVEPSAMRCRLQCPYIAGPNDFLQGVEGLTEELHANAVQVTVSFYSDPALIGNSNLVDFDLLGLQLRYLERGYRREGGDTYDSDTGTPVVFSPFEPPLLPIDTAQSYPD